MKIRRFFKPERLKKRPSRRASPVGKRGGRNRKSVVVARRLGDLVVDGVVVLVLDEGHGIVIVVGQQIVVVAVRRSHARLFRGVGGGIVVVVGSQDRLVAFLVDLGGGGFAILLLVVGVRRLGLDLIFRLLVVGRIAGTRATAAQLQRFFGIEVRAAFGAMGRAAVQVVEFRLAVGADLLGAQFGIGRGWMLSTG